ncbi:MAG: Ldh family oxidoreductase [Ruminococcaceae bacterium]|nr:Ldh family oxidoreductase [Oscillospiraceae bacterium]
MSEIIVQPEAGRQFCTEAFMALDVPQKDAELVADNLVEAELRGLSSHGLSRTIFYVNKLAGGGFKPNPEIRKVQERTSSVLFDADNSLGAVAGKRAMQACIEKAKQTGMACAAVKNGNHFGLAAYYTMMALEHDMIGISMCNSVAKMSLFGGIDPVIGTNPISIAVPAGNHWPLVFDAATSHVALGKIMVADIENKKIPENWAMDSEGQPTTDPKAALKGALLPFGGYKGSGLAIMVDVFTAVLSGAEFGMHTQELRSDPEIGQGVGFWFGAIDIAAFQDPAYFKTRMDQMIDEFKATRKAPDTAEILMPGEPEFVIKEGLLKTGFRIGPGVLSNLVSIRDRYNLKTNPEDWVRN